MQDTMLGHQVLIPKPEVTVQRLFGVLLQLFPAYSMLHRHNAESEAELLLKIPDLPSKTVNRLLSRRTGEACPAGLLDIYAQADNPRHKAGVAALLIRHGHDVPVAPG